MFIIAVTTVVVALVIAYGLAIYLNPAEKTPPRAIDPMFFSRRTNANTLR